MEEKEKVFADYIENNCESIAKEVDREFENQKGKIRKEIVNEIARYLDPVPPHYEWYDDGIPWDHSGDLRKEGTVSLDQSVEDFLEHEYTGNWTPTFESHYGKMYDTYDTNLSYTTYEIGYTIMTDVILKSLNRAFNCSLTEKDAFGYNGIFLTDYFDPVYEQCQAFEFFFASEACKYVGILNMSLQDIIAEAKKNEETC